MEDHLQLIHEIYSNLVRLKRFDAGYTSSNSDTFILGHEGKIYRVNLEEVAQKELKMEDVDKYLC